VESTPIKNTTLPHFGQGSATIRFASQQERLRLFCIPTFNIRRRLPSFCSRAYLDVNLTDDHHSFQNFYCATHISLQTTSQLASHSQLNATTCPLGILTTATGRDGSHHPTVPISPWVNRYSSNPREGQRISASSQTCIFLYIP
jgi:hypothetical protein